jgi:hypothetical protein
VTVNDLTLAQVMFLGSIAVLFFNFVVAVVSRAKDYLIGGRRVLTKQSQTPTKVE